MILIPERSFLQVHRSHIVNLDCVVALRADGQSRRVAVLANGRSLPVSQPRWESLKAALIGCDWEADEPD